MPPVVARTQLPAAVAHPDHLRIGRRLHLDLIEDDGRLGKGDRILGWRGDPTLALYVSYQMPPSWVLVRLCGDGQYRIIKQIDADPRTGVSGADIVGLLVVWLISVDPRRVNVDAGVEDHNARLAAQREAALHEYVKEEAAPRFVHALNKELGLDLLGYPA